MRTEYIYTSTGPQRPVFCGPDASRMRAILNAGTDGIARLEVSYDPAIQTEKGRVRWEEFPLDGGVLYGVTALRVVIRKVDGWVALVVEHMTDERRANDE